MYAVYNIWDTRFKDGPPPEWENKTETVAKWTDEHRERVLQALSELPEELWRTQLKGIYRLSKSILFPNPSSQMGETIVLYDTAFDKERRLSRVLAHELAHVQYLHMTDKYREGYRRTLGWKDTLLDGRTIRWAERPGNYVESDGRQGPREDFANNLEYYLFESNVLRVKTPQAYDWMKSHYGDKFKIGKGTK